MRTAQPHIDGMCGCCIFNAVRPGVKPYAPPVVIETDTPRMLPPLRPVLASCLSLAFALAGGMDAQPHPPRPPTPADVSFVSGMIVHHRQALLIAGWAPTHGASPSVRLLCDRIIVSQQDEIALMERWLRDNHQALPDTNQAAGNAMPGMAMGGPALMPGMLTPAQLAELDHAGGPDFDRLFLTFMIQHHEGALTMVQQLFNTPGAAQDGAVFQLATGVNADQTAEIDRMRRMLAALPAGARRP